jgi:CRISPR-associated exonuclease Cas4
MPVDREITGLMVYYYVVCKRKLWYFAHNITMEQNNENVEIGKIIDETSYKRDEKHINIDNVINIDFIRNKNLLHEVKKSRKIEQASILQVKYYLYYLKQKGVCVKAQIDYPLLKKTLDVELLPEDEAYFEKNLPEIEEVIKQKLPPDIKSKGICKKCAFFDLCYI